MDHVEKSYDLSFPVRYGEIGENGVATLAALGNWLQEAAGLSADSLGFGEGDMLRHNITWILTRLVLRIDRLPRAGEQLRVHTWPSTADKLAHRGYEVFDAQGRLIVSGGSAWTAMDLSERRITAIPEDISRLFPADPRPCDAFVGRVIPRLKGDSATSCLLRVRRDDLDINGHVNNTRYLSWLMETLPPTPMLSKDGQTGAEPLVPRLLDITFRAECFPQEELECLSAPSEAPAGAPAEVLSREVPWALLHSICRLSDESEVCRALTLWDRDPEAAR